MERELVKRTFALFALCATFAVPERAAAASRRIAVVVGNDAGFDRDPRLWFAERDALRFAQVIREIGGVASQDLHLLVARDADAVRNQLKKIEAELAGDTTLIFYYSGHADANGLHLGQTGLAWAELRVFLDESRARLRIAMVDACRSGNLVQAKGFDLGPTFVGTMSSTVSSRGSAVIVATEAGAIAQESAELGGSYFTHFLISGLRGAADNNGDGRVTFAEVHSYATAQTHRATGRAIAVQRPLYELDLSGYGDVVLTDLREADARLSFDPSLYGEVLVTERGSEQVVVEANKVEHAPLELALPTGRYRVHLRRPASVALAEVNLPWGGDVLISADDLETTSYQAVAQKGGEVELYRNRLRVGATIESAPIDGMGVLPGVRAGYGRNIDAFELAVRASFAMRSFDTIDTRISSRWISGGAQLTYEVPWSVIDLRAWLAVDGVYVLQRIEREGSRRASAFTASLGAGARIPIYGSMFVEAGAETRTYFLRLEGDDRSPRTTIGAQLALGTLF
jgi:hypothetical protein